jgi:hypothetical protein
MTSKVATELERIEADPVVRRRLLMMVPAGSSSSKESRETARISFTAGKWRRWWVEAQKQNRLPGSRQDSILGKWP